MEEGGEEENYGKTAAHEIRAVDTDLFYLVIFMLISL